MSQDTVDLHQCSSCSRSRPPEDFITLAGKPAVTCAKCRARRRPKSAEARAAKARDRRAYGLAQFGITIEQYELLLDIQGNVCAICGDKCLSGRRLAVDHCHETGRVRGLLCRRCNQRLGAYETFRQGAEAYLAANGKGHPLLNGEGTHAKRRVQVSLRRYGMAKLSQAQADEIRAQYAVGGATQRQLATKFGVSQNTIGCIVREERWASQENRRRALLARVRKLTDDQIAETRERHGNGEPIRSIASSLGVASSTISRIVGGKAWLHN